MHEGVGAGVGEAVGGAGVGAAVTVGVQVVSSAEASSSAPLVVPAGHAVQMLLDTYSLASQSVGVQVVFPANGLALPSEVVPGSHGWQVCDATFSLISQYNMFEHSAVLHDLLVLVVAVMLAVWTSQANIATFFFVTLRVSDAMQSVWSIQSSLHTPTACANESALNGALVKAADGLDRYFFPLKRESRSRQQPTRSFHCDRGGANFILMPHTVLFLHRDVFRDAEFMFSVWSSHLNVFLLLVTVCSNAEHASSPAHVAWHLARASAGTIEAKT